MTRVNAMEIKSQLQYCIAVREMKISKRQNEDLLKKTTFSFALIEKKSKTKKKKTKKNFGTTISSE